MVGFEEIKFLIEHEHTGKPFEKTAAIRKSDVESIHQTTDPDNEDEDRCVITMKSSSVFVSRESYEVLIKKLLPKA